MPRNLDHADLLEKEIIGVGGVLGIASREGPEGDLTVALAAFCGLMLYQRSVSSSGSGSADHVVDALKSRVKHPDLYGPWREVKAGVRKKGWMASTAEDVFKLRSDGSRRLSGIKEAIAFRSTTRRFNVRLFTERGNLQQESFFKIIRLNTSWKPYMISALRGSVLLEDQEERMAHARDLVRSEDWAAMQLLAWRNDCELTQSYLDEHSQGLPLVEIFTQGAGK